MAKITYDYVKDFVESFGYQLVSNEYVKSGDRLDMICEKSHNCSISWDNFKYGRRCRACADLNKANKFKLEYEKVRTYIESFGCKLINESYKNNTQKLDIICSCGDSYKTTLHRFKEDERYTKCQKCRERKSKKHSYNYVKEIFESNEYTLLSQDYVDANKKLKVECPEGHIYHTTFANFNSGKRCPYCCGTKKFSIDEVREMLNAEGYVLLDDSYKNAKTRVNIICDKGHKTTIAIADFRSGVRCNICGVSKGEMSVIKYLGKKNIRNIYNTEYFDDLLGVGGNPLRPDFILPDHKIWIEYDGEFHYRKMYNDDGHEKIKIHDKLKDEYAKKHNWKMIRIPYWEFENIENILNKEII